MKLLPLLCLLFQWFGPTSAKENGPGVVTVSEDDDALLPCSLDSKQKVEKFDWRKDNGDNSKKEVFFYDRGSHYLNLLKGQDEQFKKRVLFFEDELELGNASIQIKNTRLEDNGTYSCVIFEPFRKEIQIRLNVGAARKPYVKSLREENKWSLLECEVQGSPKPDVEWKNSAGKVLDKQTNVSQLKVNVTKSDNYTCVATQLSFFHQINNTLEVNIQDAVDSVAVVEGGDAVLPCSLESKETVNMFKWRKGKKEVYFYNRSQVEHDEQFTGRVTHFEAGLNFGNASIKILNTHLSDRGRYTCNLPDKQQSHVELHILEKNDTPDSAHIHIGWFLFAIFVGLLIIGVLLVKNCQRQRSSGRSSRQNCEQLFEQGQNKN